MIYLDSARTSNSDDLTLELFEDRVVCSSLRMFKMIVILIKEEAMTDLQGPLCPLQGSVDPED